MTKIKVITIEPTPNPNALKFVLNKRISDTPQSFFGESAAADHPLAQKLFAIAGVSAVLILGDFITINRNPNFNWGEIKNQAKKCIETTT